MSNNKLWKTIIDIAIMVLTTIGGYLGASANVNGLIQFCCVMASRYPTTKVLDYCFNPVQVHLSREEVTYVPCGKCDGCLLHKANEWSMRLGCEIESCPFPIFYTLTYSNNYLPVAVFHGYNYDSNFPTKVFTPYHDRNIRFNGKKDVLRTEKFGLFSLPLDFHGIPATNYKIDLEYFPYSSKRDFQLFLKSLRKSIDEKFKEKTSEERKIRSFAISEYGETLLRPHIHGVLFAYDGEVSDYLLYSGIYENWQMCDRSQFDEFCHLCDSGCRGYVTQYLTCSASLPQVYKDDRIKPWRLSSKNPAIGFSEFNKEKIYEDVLCGIIEFSKDIKRLNERYILRYPQKVVSRLFPKCYEYSHSNIHRLRFVYGLYFNFEREKYEFSQDLLRRLSADMRPQDEQAAVKCLMFCESLGVDVDTYLYALDLYYYKADMMALKYYYSWQESEVDKFKVLRSYRNLYEYSDMWRNNMLDSYRSFVFGNFMESFGISPDDVGDMDVLDHFNLVDPVYVTEIESIMDDMVKMPKFNEEFGFSPNSVSNIV